jgi:hypothetical protein
MARYGIKTHGRIGVEGVSVAVFGKYLAQHKGFLKNAESNTNGIACVKAAFWS